MTDREFDTMVDLARVAKHCLNIAGAAAAAARFMGAYQGLDVEYVELLTRDALARLGEVAPEALREAEQ